MKKEKRIEWIDYLKAFACFLVVLGHLLQSLQKANIDNHRNITEFIIWFIYLFHMPLFMCMSGILYHKKKQKFSTVKEYLKFEKDKFINLSIPYFVFYLVYVLVNMLFSNSVNSKKGIEDILAIFNNPISPYWFLYALWAIFVIVPIIERLFKYDKKKVCIFFFILKILAIFISTPIYFINQIMFYGIYFYLGAFIKYDIKEKNLKKIILSLCMIVIYLLASTVIYRYKDNINTNFVDFFKMMFALVGIFINIFIFKMIYKNKILEKYKKYTFQIFILHTIFAAGIRILLLKLNITNYIIHFILGILFSIYIPVLISIISNKIVITDIFFFPIKTIKKIKEKN